MKTKSVLLVCLILILFGSTSFASVSPDAAVTKPSVSLVLNRTTAEAGDTLVATLKIEGTVVSGFQVNIKYDPLVIKPINPVNGYSYKTNTYPTMGGSINSSYYYFFASHDLSNGFLNFGESCLNFSKISSTRVVYAQIGFKVLMKAPIKLAFNSTSSTPDSVYGTYLFDLNANQIKDYNVIQPSVVNAPPVTYGDLDASGSIDSTDYAIMKRHILGIINMFSPDWPYNWKAADLDGDGMISSTDYAYLQRRILRIIPKFPVEP